MKKKVLICCIVIVYMGGVVQGTKIRKNMPEKCNTVSILSSQKILAENTSVDRYEIVLIDWAIPRSQMDWAEDIMKMYLQNSLPGVYITNVADMAEISVYLTSEMWQESIPYFIVQYNNITGSYKVRRRRKA